MLWVGDMMVWVGLWACVGRGAADLVLAGGNVADDNAEVYGKIVDLAGGEGVARIGVITTASSEPLQSATFYTDLFLLHGAAKATWIPVTETSNDADTEQIYDLVKEQTGLFFGGGNQARIMVAWRRPDGTDTLGLQAIKEVEAAGGVVGGTSAGAACQGSGPMVETGFSYQGLRYGAYPGGYYPLSPENLHYDERGGLALLPNYTVDVHFAEEGREGRLMKLIQDTMTADASTRWAVGIDENTAIHIDSTGLATVLGNAGGALLIDLMALEELSGLYTRWNNARVSFFCEGDSFNLYDGTFTMASWKSDLAGEEWFETAPSSDDIFSSPERLPRQSGVFREMARFLWDSKISNTTHVTYETSPQFVVTMRKADGLSYGADSPTTGLFVASFSRLAVDMDYID